MSRQIGVLIIGVLTLLAALAVAGFFYTFESVEETVPGKASGRARNNPYLALEYLFDQSEFDAESYLRLDASNQNTDGIFDENSFAKPESNRLFDADIIYWMTPKHDASPAQLEILYNWVLLGGHLIARGRV